MAPQMVQAGYGHVGVMSRLGQNKGTLDRGLNVKSQAFGCPGGGNVALTHCFFDIGLKGGSVVADALIACFADLRVRVVDLLDHGSSQTREIGEVPLEHGFAEIDICKQAIQGISEGAICTEREERRGGVSPVFCCFQGKFFLAFEVMEEAALGESGGPANIL